MQKRFLDLSIDRVWLFFYGKTQLRVYVFSNVMCPFT